MLCKSWKALRTKKTLLNFPSKSHRSFTSKRSCQLHSRRRICLTKNLMSLFIDNNSLSPQQVSQQKLELAKFQYDALNGLYETIRLTCGKKCIPLDYGENDLSKGEGECDNRCVAKFMEAHKIIGNFVETGRRFSDKDLKLYEHVKKEYLSGPDPSN